VLPKSLGIVVAQSGIAGRVLGHLGIVAVPMPEGIGYRLHGHLDAAAVVQEGVVGRMLARSDNMDSEEVVARVGLTICFARDRSGVYSCWRC
jgi:hypothetical protein